MSPKNFVLDTRGIILSLILISFELVLIKIYLILLSYYYSCFCVYYHIWILQALLINIICINSMRVLTTATTTSIIICNYDYSILITTHYSYTRTCNLLLPCHAYIIYIVPFLFKSTLAYDSFKSKIVIHVGDVNTMLIIKVFT